MKKFILATLIIGCIAGLTTVILSILGLAGVPGVDAGAVLRWIVVVTLALNGIIFLVLGLTRSLDSVRNLLTAALFIGLSIFLSLDEGNGVFDTLFVIIIPLIAACFGGGLLIRAIILLASKNNERSNIFMLIIGMLLLSVGLTFAILAHKGNMDITYIVWFLVGAGIIVVSSLGLAKEIK